MDTNRLTESARQRASGFDLVADFAKAAQPVALPVMNEDALFASIETRLTKEMRDLALVLQQFSRRAQLIGEDLPASAQFCKLVTGFLSLVSLQLAAALSQGLDEGIFLDDGRQYLAQLHLSLDDLIREVDLDGRKFMAVALIGDQPGPFFGRGQSAEDR